MGRPVSPGARSDAWENVPVAVAGAGLIGLTLALALARACVRCALVEATPDEPADTKRYADRPIALSFGSRRILQALGAWRELEAHTSPIRRIHVSDRGHFGVARLEADALGVDALGYVIEARQLEQTLLHQVSGCGNVQWRRPASIESVGLEPRAARLQIRASTGGIEKSSTETTLHASLLVVAEGGRSTLRERLGIAAREHDYEQVAITAVVEPVEDHGHTAYERFTDTGPLALLPLPDRRCGLVWTLPPEQADAVLAMTDAGFLDALTDRFGTRLGGFERTGPRHRHPLSLITSQSQIAERAVVVGNAAHNLHPIAGQGMNLGLRDVAALAETVVGALRAGDDPGRPEILRGYEGWRKADQRTVVRATHGLVQLFSNRRAPLVIARNVGLVAFDLLPGVKRGFAAHAMGLAGRQPRLSRGLAL